VTQDKFNGAENESRRGIPVEAFSESSKEEALQARERTVSRLRLLWDNRGRLARVFAWSFAVSVPLVLLIPNRYEAVTRLMPPDSQSGSALAMLTALTGKTGAASVGGLAGDLLGVKSSGALFVGILGSQSVQDRLIEEFDLRHVYKSPKIEDARDSLSKHTDISEDRKSGIITVKVTDHDPRRAADIATAYVHELDRLVAQVSTSSARRERIFLEGRLRSVKQDLDTAARNFSDFASKNTAIDIPAQGKAMVEGAARLQGELIAAESSLRGLEAIYTDENVRVRAMRARVNELRAQLEKLGGDTTTSSSGKPSEDSTPIYPPLRKLPILGVTYADLYRQTKIQETVYELLTQQYELAKVQEAKEIPSVKVLDAAVVPTKKTFPPRTLTVLLSTFVCLLLFCAWLFARESWEHMAPQDPAKQFVQEVLGTLQADARRFAPGGPVLLKIFSRLRPGTIKSYPGVDEASDKKSAEEQEVVRAAGSRS